MEPQNTRNTLTDSDTGGVNLLTERIINCTLTVLHTLGTGFLEKVYERALVHELSKAGVAVSRQHLMTVRYDGIVVGQYTIDLLVERTVLVELQVASVEGTVTIATGILSLISGADTAVHMVPGSCL